MISTSDIQSQWNEIKHKLQERWRQLTDEDLKFDPNHPDQFYQRIQARTGEGRQQIESFINESVEQARHAGARMGEQARHVGAQATEQGKHMVESARQQARSGMQRAQRMVNENPTGSMATVFGLGMVSGLIVGLMLFSD